MHLNLFSTGKKSTKRKKRKVNDLPSNYPKANPKYRDKTKRILDIAICTPVLIIGLIPMAITAVASRMSSKGQKNKNNFKKHLQGVIFLHFFEVLCPYYGYREVPQHSYEYMV